MFLNAILKSVNNPEDRFFVPYEDIVHFMERYENNEFSLMLDELNVPFNLEEPITSVKQLNSNKSGRPDLYLNEIFYTW